MMLNEFNTTIKRTIKASGLRHYDVAKVLGIDPSTLSVWLRSEPLPKDRECLIMAAIERCKNGK